MSFIKFEIIPLFHLSLFQTGTTFSWISVDLRMCFLAQAQMVLRNIIYPRRIIRCGNRNRCIK
jgi:hypothetical protein